MELYVQVGFWMGIFGLVVNLISMAVVEYPTKINQTLGYKLVQVIVGGGFAVWAGSLLFY